MIQARGLIVLGWDAHLVQLLDRLHGIDGVVEAHCAARHKEEMYLLVELVGTGKATIVGSPYVHPKEGGAERPHPSELVHARHHEVERLVSAPRQTCHCAVLTVGKGAEVAVDVRDEVVPHHLVECHAVLITTSRNLN